MSTVSSTTGGPTVRTNTTDKPEVDPKPNAQPDAAGAAPPTPAAKGDGYKGTGIDPKGPDLGKPGSTEAPTTAEALKKVFPELAGRTDLEDIRKNVATVTDPAAAPQDKVVALARLTAAFPNTLKESLGKLGIHDPLVGKLLDSPQVLKDAATALDPKKGASERIAATLSFANGASKLLPKDALTGIAKEITAGLPAAAKVVNLVGALTDPDKTPLDKAKAALDVAKELQKSGGEVFPQLAERLKALKGPLAVVDGAFTLLDPKKSATEKASAALSIWGNAHDAAEGVLKLKDWFSANGVPAGEADKISAATATAPRTVSEDLSKSVKPDVLNKLSGEEVAQLEKLAADASVKDSLPALLKNVSTPEQLRGLLSVTGEKPNAELIGTLSKMEPEALGRVLTDTVDGRPMVKVLDETLSKVPKEARAIVAKMVSEFDGPGAKSFLRLAQNLDGDLLGRVVSGIDKVSGTLGGMKGVGKLFEAFDKVVAKSGLKLGPKVAAKIVGTIAKVVPLAGAIPAGADAVRMGIVAANPNLPPEIRFVAGMASVLNGVDAGVAVADALGVTDVVGLPVAVGLSVAELGLDLSVDHMMEENKEGHFKPSEQLNAAIGGMALATSPVGEALLFGLFGPKAAQEKLLATTKVAANAVISTAEGSAVGQANAAGAVLHATAEGINGLADVIRNPEKYGRMGKVLAQGATDRLVALSGEAGAAGSQALGTLREVAGELAKKGEAGIKQLESIAMHPTEAGKVAVDALRDLARQGLDSVSQTAQESGKKALAALESVAKSVGQQSTQYASHVVQAVDQTVDALAKSGAKGLAALQELASHPSEAGDAALRGLEGLASAGGQLGKDATERLISLGDRGAKALQNVAQTLVKKGEQGLEMLDFIVHHPGASAQAAAATALAGVKSLAESGGTAAHAALDKLRQWSDEETQFGKEAVATLGGIVHRGGAAAEHVLGAWRDNLTRGGREVFAAVARLRGN